MDKKKRIKDLLAEWRMYPIEHPYEHNANTLQGLKEMIDENITSNMKICEIGSFAGVSSELFALHCKELHCIDPWSAYIEIDDIDTMKEAERRFDFMRKSYNNIFKLKMSSEDAYKIYPNFYFDCIYIDGAHFYEPLKQDILNWIPKIKKNGILVGHDIYMVDINAAVNELFREYGIVEKVYPDSSWLIKMSDYYDKVLNKDVLTSNIEVVINEINGGVIFVYPKININNIKIVIKDLNSNQLYAGDIFNLDIRQSYWISPENKSYLDGFIFEIMDEKDNVILKKII